MNTNPVVLITGVSSGLGKACFDYLSSKNFQVYGTSRNADGKNAQLLFMDVTDKTSIHRAVQKIVAEEGKIDILINNAGIAIVGSAELSMEADARMQLETNFWGVVNVTNEVLPHMRKQRAGKIINISSLGGLFAIPFQGFYTASKHALEGYSEALRMEVRHLGIHISLVEPGDFQTKISENRIYSAKEDSTDYREDFAAACEVIVGGERNGAQPIRVAKLCEKIIQSKRPKLRYRIGKPLDLLAATLKPILPQGLFEWLIMDHYGLKGRK